MNVLLESSGTDRPVFWRERESGLNVKAFFVAKVVGEPSDTDGNKEGNTMDNTEIMTILEFILHHRIISYSFYSFFSSLPSAFSSSSFSAVAVPEAANSIDLVLQCFLLTSAGNSFDLT